MLSSPDWWIDNYTTNLDDMHKAEQILSDKQFFKYLFELEYILGFNSGPGGWDMDTESLKAMVTATAAQRAEAFIRAIGKWTE